MKRVKKKMSLLCTLIIGLYILLGVFTVAIAGEAGGQDVQFKNRLESVTITNNGGNSGGSLTGQQPGNDNSFWQDILDNIKSTIDWITDKVKELWDVTPQWLKQLLRGIAAGIIAATVIVIIGVALVFAGIITVSVVVIGAVLAIIAAVIYSFVIGEKGFNWWHAIGAGIMGGSIGLLLGAWLTATVWPWLTGTAWPWITGTALPWLVGTLRAIPLLLRTFFTRTVPTFISGLLRGIFARLGQTRLVQWLVNSRAWQWLSRAVFARIGQSALWQWLSKVVWVDLIANFFKNFAIGGFISSAFYLFTEPNRSLTGMVSNFISGGLSNAVGGPLMAGLLKAKWFNNIVSIITLRVPSLLKRLPLPGFIKEKISIVWSYGEKVTVLSFSGNILKWAGYYTFSGAIGVGTGWLGSIITGEEFTYPKVVGSAVGGLAGGYLLLKYKFFVNLNIPGELIDTGSNTISESVNRIFTEISRSFNPRTTSVKSSLSLEGETTASTTINCKVCHQQPELSATTEFISNNVTSSVYEHVKNPTNLSDYISNTTCGNGVEQSTSSTRNELHK